MNKRAVSYTFNASNTSEVTYKATFTHQRSGIPLPDVQTFDNAGQHTKSGLFPDVTYTLQLVAVRNGAESAAISTEFITKPDGKTTYVEQSAVSYYLYNEHTVIYNDIVIS